MKKILYLSVILCFSYTLTQAQPLAGTRWRANHALETAMMAFYTPVDSIVMEFNTGGGYRFKLYSADTLYSSNGTWSQTSDTSYQYIDTTAGDFGMVCQIPDTGNFNYVIIGDTLRQSHYTGNCAILGSVEAGDYYRPHISTGVSNAPAQEQIVSIYPNPAGKTANLQFPFAGPLQFSDIAVVDMQGREYPLQAIVSSGRISLNTEVLKPGVYYLQVVVNGGAQAL